MIVRETLGDGSTRLRAGSCSFLFNRIAPGVLYTSVAGLDTGDLGTAPLDEFKAEYLRFRQPLSLFIDAREAPNVVSKVFHQWTGWLTNHQDLFKGIYVLTDHKAMFLTISIARHLSSTERLLNLYESKTDFDRVVAQFGEHSSITNWVDTAPVKVLKECLPDGTIGLRNANVSFTFQRKTNDVLYSTVIGFDDGSLGNAPFELLLEELDLHKRAISWFVDVSHCTGVVKRVPEAWTTFIVAHHQAIAHVGILTPQGALPLLVDATRFRQNAHSRISVYKSGDQFQESLDRSLVKV